MYHLISYPVISSTRTRTSQWTVFSSFEATGGGDCRVWYVLPKLWLMAKILCVCKCSQGLRKVITVLAMLVEVWWVEVVSRLHLSSSARQSKHREPHQSSWARPQCPCVLVCYSPPKVNYSGASKGCLAICKEFKSWSLKIPVRPNEKINRPINQYTAKLHTHSNVVCRG